MEVLGINKKSLNILDIYIFIYKRDYSPNILAVLTSQFLGWCFPKSSPPPPSDGDRFLALTFTGVGNRQTDLDSLEIYTIPLILLMPTNVCTENYEI